MNKYCTLDQAVNHARVYLSSSLIQPLFICFDNFQQIDKLTSELTSCTKIKISQFCRLEDSLPDLDLLFNQILSSSQNQLLLGVGEYVALFGHDNVINRLLTINLTHRKLIVLLWNQYNKLYSIQNQDKRINDLGLFKYLEPTKEFWKFKQFDHRLDIDNIDCKGVKSFLASVEQGCNSTLRIQTRTNPSLFYGKKINSYCELYKELTPHCIIPDSMFSNDQWKLFIDSLDFIDDQIDSPFYLRKMLEEGTDNKYLKFVIDNSINFEDYQKNLLFSFLNCDTKNENFQSIYKDRKKILAKISKDQINDYIVKSRKFEPETQIFYLSNTTNEEKFEILRIISHSRENIPSLEFIYPELYYYIKEIPQNITSEEFYPYIKYFNQYKYQKIKNEISKEFLLYVDDIAKERPYNKLPSRNSILEQLNNSQTELFWIDALGCEYLNFIIQTINKKGLQCKINFARANLPTITSYNNSYYHSWNGPKRLYQDLDHIKHGDFEQQNIYNTKDFPIHLVYELEIIKAHIDTIFNDLKTKNIDKIIITSDHGATRLAILAKKENSWEMTEPGKHGGRCCKVSEFDGNLPETATLDNDGKWNVLANYERFKGGRLGDVEVHGGATLEEVVVPIIEIKLASKISFELFTPNIKLGYRDSNFMIRFYCSKKLKNANLILERQAYTIEILDEVNSTYKTSIPKKAPGTYSACIVEGATKITEFQFTLESSVASSQNDDWFNL